MSTAGRQGGVCTRQGQTREWHTTSERARMAALHIICSTASPITPSPPAHSPAQGVAEQEAARPRQQYRSCHHASRNALLPVVHCNAAHATPQQLQRLRLGGLWCGREQGRWAANQYGLPVSSSMAMQHCARALPDVASHRLTWQHTPAGCCTDPAQPAGSTASTVPTS